MREPYEYQKGIIARSIERPFTMVNAACGTGKSLMASQTAIGKGKPTLIITPKNVMEDFKAELMADGVPAEDIFVYSAAESHKDGYFNALLAWLGYAEKQAAEEATEDMEENEVVF